MSPKPGTQTHPPFPCKPSNKASHALTSLRRQVSCVGSIQQQALQAGVEERPERLHQSFLHLLSCLRPLHRLLRSMWR